MKTISYVLAVAWKELLIIAKDRGSLALFFLLPLILTTVQGGANLQSDEESGSPSILLRVGLVNKDPGDFGREVTQAIARIDELDVLFYETAGLAEKQVAEGEIAAAIIIPDSFSENINSYTPTSIEVMVDPAQPQSTSIVTGIMNQVVDEVTIWGEVQHGIRTVMDESGLLAGASPEQRRAVEAQNLGVIMTRLNEVRRDPAIAVVSEDLEGVTVEVGFNTFLAYIFAGYTVMFIFFIVSTAAPSLLKERETGTLRRLVAAPIPRGAIIAGKIIAFMVIPCLQTAVLFGVANLFFKIPLGRSPLGMIVLTLVVAAVATSLGLLIAAVAKTSGQASSIGTILGFALAIVGGALPLVPSPFSRMGGGMAVLSAFIPHSQAIEGYYSLMVDNATFIQILPEIGTLLLFGVAFFLISMWRFRFE